MKHGLRVPGWAALILLAALAAGCGGRATDRQAGAGSQPAGPDFNLVSLDGRPLRLSDMRGQVVIVDFWATWCGPCKMALPHLQEIHDRFAGKGVTIVAIAMDDEGESVVRPFVAKHGLRFPVALPDGQVAQVFAPIRGFPTTIVIGPDGQVYKRYLGYQPPQTLLKDIAALKPELAGETSG